MQRYRITISGPDKAAMADLVRKHDIQIFDHGIRFAPDIGYTVAAFAAPDETRKLQQNGYVVVQHEDADELGKIRHRDLGRGNRYTSTPHDPPRTYPNLHEVAPSILPASPPPSS